MVVLCVCALQSARSPQIYANYARDSQLTLIIVSFQARYLQRAMLCYAADYDLNPRRLLWVCGFHVIREYVSISISLGLFLQFFNFSARWRGA